MNRFLIISKILAALLILCFSSQSSKAQNTAKSVFKKYVQADSNAIQYGATLTIFADKTFTNYGIVKDSQNNEEYVWYTFGKWNLKNGEILCRTYFESFNHKRMIDEILFNYKQRADFKLIEEKYEFKNENYMNYSFIMIKNKVIDLNKKIEYVELAQDQL